MLSSRQIMAFRKQLKNAWLQTNPKKTVFCTLFPAPVTLANKCELSQLFIDSIAQFFGFLKPSSAQECITPFIYEISYHLNVHIQKHPKDVYLNHLFSITLSLLVKALIIDADSAELNNSFATCMQNAEKLLSQDELEKHLQDHCSIKKKYAELSQDNAHDFFWHSISRFLQDLKVIYKSQPAIFSHHLEKIMVRFATSQSIETLYNKLVADGNIKEQFPTASDYFAAELTRFTQPSFNSPQNRN